MQYSNYNDYINSINNPGVNYINDAYTNSPYINDTYIDYRKSSTIPKKIGANESLKDALILIKKSVESEKEDEMFYDILLLQATSSRDKEIIQSIVNDERKHNKLFRELYYELTGITLPKYELKSVENSKNTYISNLEKALFGELSAVEKYRKIMAAMPDKQKYNTMMEIMTDELKHASKYNFLIAKNIK